MTDQAPHPVEPPLVERRNALRLSLVWLVPLVAVLVGLVLVVRHFMHVGPEIVIEFRTAEGLEAGKTDVRYKEVVVGRVTQVGLSEDRQRVVATVRLDKSSAAMAVEDSRFWVVRPRIGTAGVSGLNTLVSGAYIGVDAGVSTESRRRFEGLEAPPFVLRNEPGRSFVLDAEDLGSLDIGSPVYYRRTRVGRVVGFVLQPDPDRLTVQIFIESPNERLVTAQSRFWNASGIDLRLNASGLTLNTQSLASVVAGGVGFANAPSAAPAAQAPEGTRFKLFADRASALAPPDGPPMPVRMVFEESARGLSVNAPIEVLGVEVGRVRTVALRHEKVREHFAVEVQADLYPLRMGVTQLAGMPADGRELMKQLVDHGLRAQLRTGNLFTGQMYVALDFPSRRQPPAVWGLDDGVPTLPTMSGEFGQLQPQVMQIVQRLSQVPFDQIGRDLRGTLRGVNEAIRQLRPEARSALAGVQATLESVQRTLGAGERTLQQFDRNLAAEDSPLQRNANQTFEELQRAAKALRELGDYLQRHPESILRGKPPDPAPTAASPR
ncbi:MAG TPA: MlaD family protein [Burkholderiaceae bacterium]|nr:MlaD family protein [Burkholderiaceae bacterium]